MSKRPERLTRLRHDAHRRLHALDQRQQRAKPDGDGDQPPVKRRLQDQLRKHEQHQRREQACPRPKEDQRAHEDTLGPDRGVMIAARHGPRHARPFQLGKRGDAYIDGAEEQHAHRDRRKGRRTREQRHDIAVRVGRRLGRKHADEGPSGLLAPHRTIGADRPGQPQGKVPPQIGEPERQQSGKARHHQHRADARQISTRPGGHQQTGNDRPGIGKVGSCRPRWPVMRIGIGPPEPANEGQCASQPEHCCGCRRSRRPGNARADQPLACRQQQVHRKKEVERLVIGLIILIDRDRIRRRNQRVRQAIAELDDDQQECQRTDRRRAQMMNRKQLHGQMADRNNGGREAGKAEAAKDAAKFPHAPFGFPLPQAGGG